MLGEKARCLSLHSPSRDNVRSVGYVKEVPATDSPRKYKSQIDDTYKLIY